MKLLLTLCLAFVLASLVNGQQTRPVTGRHVEELILRIETIEKDNAFLKSQIRERDSITYIHLRKQILLAYSSTPQLSSDFRNTQEKIAVTGIFARLMQVNNPTSDILGFRFSDIIYSTCEKHFLEKLENEKEKNRFGHVILKILNNPVVSSLANTNPVTSIIGSIISIIASFTISSAEISRDGNKVKKVRVTQHDAFDQEDIAAFKNDLQVYINFYEALSEASEQYLGGLDYLNIKYTNLMQTIKSYEQELYSVLETEKHIDISRLNTILPDPEREKVVFSCYNNDPVTSAAFSEAEKFPLIQQSVNDFKKEYNQLLFRFLEQYLLLLEMTKTFPEGIVDPLKISNLIKDINVFIEDQKERDNDQQDGSDIM